MNFLKLWRGASRAKKSTIASERRTDKLESLDRKIWIFGPSAIGKKTLIYDLARLGSPRDCGFSKRLDLRPRQTILPVVLDNSPRDKTTEEFNALRQQRMALVRKIHRANFGVTWLIQGQTIDLRPGFLPRFVTQIGEKLPNSTAVYLRVSEALFAKTHMVSRPEPLSYERAYQAQTETVALLQDLFPEVIIYEMN